MVSLRALSAGALGGVSLVAVGAAVISLSQGCSVGVLTSNVSAGDGGFAGDDGGSSSGGSTGDATTCQPGDVRTFAPLAYTPASPPFQDWCSPDQMAAAYHDCVDPSSASTAACAAFSDPDASTGRCAACLVTPATASSFGPFIDRGTYLTENASGCIELTDPGPGGLTCAKAQQALEGCELAACAAFCPAYDSASRAVLDDCMAQAAAGGCQMFARQADCARALADAGRAAQCTGLSLQAFFFAVAPLFCGDSPAADGSAPPSDGSGGPIDAGYGGDAAGSTDAEADASADAAPSDALVPEGGSEGGPAPDAGSDATMPGDAQADAPAD